MLKQQVGGPPVGVWRPAAFRRLCVETTVWQVCLRPNSPAAFRRLCVETSSVALSPEALTPAAFRRLCVETI